jgi:DNA excision repair protein ERCC-4
VKKCADSNDFFRIIIDSREQKPYRFECYAVRALPAGDYSIEGMENRVAVERKSKVDAYGTIGAGRDRFVRELEKLAKYDYAAVVIECSLSDFIKPPPRSELNPRSAINSLVAWSVRYGVHVFFADNRLLARALTYRILEKFYRERKKPCGFSE